MIRRFWIICLLFLVGGRFGTKGLAQDTLAFSLTDQGLMIFPAKINQVHQVDLMLHTAAEGFSLIETVADSLFPSDTGEVYNAHSWGGDQQGRFLRNQQLGLGGMTIDSLILWVNRLSGKGSDGKFGPDLLGSAWLKIDPATGLLIRYQSLPDRFEIRGYTPVKTTQGPLGLMLELELGLGTEKIQHSFLMHSGYGAGLLLDDEFAATHQISEKVVIESESELRDAYGNVLKTQKARLSELRLGRQRLADVPMSFFSGAIGRQKVSVMGAGVISQFQWLIHFPSGQVYVKTG
ncbi:MAG: hypothetical protein AAFR61_20905 [Bacteroidota bacterium]